MSYQIHKAVVIGAGTMGAALAAHLANAGVSVTLLDIVPRELTPQEEKQGLTLEDKQVRNRIVNAGLEAVKKSKPAAFMDESRYALVSTGNLEDDLDVVAEADWVIEAIVENLKIKQSLMEKLDEKRGQKTIISTNTSGIPVGEIAEGRSRGFREHFLGTHFFNPPRYLKLLEIIPGPDTQPEVVVDISAFGEQRLGKGIVVCKDTPNFVGNRILSVAGAFAMDYAIANGYTVKEIDTITGPSIGRPKTATFRLMDLVGIDVLNHVSTNLAAAIPEDAWAQRALNAAAVNNLMSTMLDNGWLGNKARQGFYKRVDKDGQREFWELNLATLEHEPPGEKVRFDSIGEARKQETFPEQMKVLLAGEDRAAEFVRTITYHDLAYASRVIPEIADLPKAIDDAMRWGFAHKAGPFELWDGLGVAETAEKMKQAGFPPAEWVAEMLAAGHETFYQYQDSTKVGIYNPVEKQYEPIKISPKIINLKAKKAAGKVITRNPGATLIDIGDGVALVTFDTKLGALDDDISKMVNEALDRAESDFEGVVLSHDGEHFSAGANLAMVLMAAKSGMWPLLEQAIDGLQGVNMRMRYFPKPVVVAPFGYTFGGGCEVTMHAPRVVAAAELYIGLVEVGVGVIPAGGGTKEIMRRFVNPHMRISDSDYLPPLQRAFEQIGMAKVATSALEARSMGILGPCDRVVMNRDYLIAEAKREVLHMAESGYAPPVPEKIYAAGRDALAALRVGLHMFKEGGYISDYDAVIGEKLITILAGGELSKPAWVSEQYILDLEKEAFLSLCGEEKTQERIYHMLETGKPLRN